MNDCKDLIQRMKLTVENPIVGEAVNAIETLEKERNAAINELRGICWACINAEKYPPSPTGLMVTCPHMRERGKAACAGRGGSDCPHWEWRGVCRD